jgi:hypothetical protein
VRLVEGRRQESGRWESEAGTICFDLGVGTRRAIAFAATRWPRSRPPWVALDHRFTRGREPVPGFVSREAIKRRTRGERSRTVPRVALTLGTISVNATGPWRTARLPLALWNVELACIDRVVPAIPLGAIGGVGFVVDCG